MLRKRGLNMDVRYFAEHVLDIATRMNAKGIEKAVSVGNQILSCLGNGVSSFEKAKLYIN